MPFIMAVLALGLAGSTGWAFFHYVVRFFWPEAGYYAVCITWVLYVYGLIHPSIRRLIRRLLTICLYGCIGYIGWAMYRGDEPLLTLEKVAVTIPYLFFVRFFVDGSFERGLRKVFRQIRDYGWLLGKPVLTNSVGCLVCACAIYCGFRFVNSHKFGTNAADVWIMFVCIFVLPWVFMWFFSSSFFWFVDFIGVFIPAPDYPATLPPQEDIYNSTRGYALTHQIDAAARGEASGSDFNPQFED